MAADVSLRQLLAQVEENPSLWDQAAQVSHVTIRLVPADELQLDEAMPCGRPPMEIVEHRPDRTPYLHGAERGIAPHKLRKRARAVADRLGVNYVDPGADVLDLLLSAEAV